MIKSMLLAFGLVLIIEGLFPFAAPDVWRLAFLKLCARPSRHVRIGGLLTILLGLLILLLR